MRTSLGPLFAFPAPTPFPGSVLPSKPEPQPSQNGLSGGSSSFTGICRGSCDAALERYARTNYSTRCPGNVDCVASAPRLAMTLSVLRRLSLPTHARKALSWHLTFPVGCYFFPGSEIALRYSVCSPQEKDAQGGYAQSAHKQGKKSFYGVEIIFVRLYN